MELTPASSVPSLVEFRQTNLNWPPSGSQAKSLLCHHTGHTHMQYAYYYSKVKSNLNRMKYIWLNNFSHILFLDFRVDNLALLNVTHCKVCRE